MNVTFIAEVSAGFMRMGVLDWSVGVYGPVHYTCEMFFQELIAVRLYGVNNCQLDLMF